MRIKFLGGVLLTLLVCSLTFGQVPEIDLDKPIGEQLLLPQVPQGGQKPALEGAVNPDEYVLGPSDMLEFNIWGGIELSYELTIAPDGTVGIPVVGEMKLAGLTLSAAKDTVFMVAQKAYPKSELSLRLINIRIMKVSVSGVILGPGTYGVSSVDRVSALISAAGGIPVEEAETPLSTKIERRAILEEQEEEEARSLAEPSQDMPEASLRRVKLTSRDGNARNIDYLRFLRSGKLEYNPVLMDGDEVHIPVKEKRFGVVHVFGEVKLPGEYEFLEGDDIAALIDVSGGFTSSALKNAVDLVRFDRLTGKYNQIVLDLTSSSGMKTRLQPEDRIFIRLDNSLKPKHFVRINGEVKFPGVYPIEDNVTMLTELVGAAGGLKDQANLNNAVIMRWIDTRALDIEIKRLQVVPIADMTELEYEYFKAHSRQDVPKVTVNFKKLFIDNDDSEDIALRNLDEITIPTLSATVKVTGSVVNPGLIAFKPGEDFEYYIDQAGGYTFNAQKGKLRLIKARTGAWAELDHDTDIEIGDTIFIPEKDEINSWELFKDILLVLTQLATLTLLLR